MAELPADPEQNARAVEVLQRLLTDPEFRQTFRRDPGSACLSAGLTEAAAEFQGGGSALHTLEVRESKSSLAGLLMAAAAEGAAVYQFAEHLRSHLDSEMAAIAQQAADRAGAQGHAAAEHLIAAHADALPAAPAPGAGAGGLLDHADAAVGAGGAADPGQHVVHLASKFIGVPYVWGGESPSGFDCSGLVQYCFKQIGVHLERTTWDQVKEGRAVQWGHFQPGDLIFSNFEGPGAGATHVVIYAGHGQVIAAPHTGGHVEYESVDVFKPYFMGARRVVPDAPMGGLGGAGVQAVEPAAAGHAAPGTFGMSAVPAAAQPSGGGGGGANAAGVHSTVGHSTFGSMPAHGGSAADAMHGGGASVDMIGAYPGDNAPRAAIAHWMADAARKAGLPPELPVMASLVESGLKNDHFGDRDSLGFFQMRTSVWDHGKYAGFPKDPRLQLRWFLDEAVALKQQRLSEGYHNFGTDPHKWGDWIADIERPATQYRGRYQLQLDTARGLVR